MLVVGLALGAVVGEADVVVRRQEQAGAFALQPAPDCGGLFGCGFLLGQDVIEPEHHQRVGVGQDPLIDWQLVAGLVDALEHRDGMTGHLTGKLLKRQS